jgi:hypothetical protein
MNILAAAAFIFLLPVQFLLHREHDFFEEEALRGIKQSDF